MLGGQILELRGRNLATYIPVTMRVSKVFFFSFGRTFKTEQFKKKSKLIAFILFCKNAF